MKREKERIAMGSVNIYMMLWNGSSTDDIPEDSVIETEANFIGHTKDGGTISYKPTYYTAKSDDGKVSRIELTEEEVTISFGLITWNGDTITKIVPTASTETNGTRRTTFIGGIDNDNGTVYLIRAVHPDKIKGDVRYTAIGKNVQGFASTYKKGQESVITPEISTEAFSDGRLLVMYEDSIDTASSEEDDENNGTG